MGARGVGPLVGVDDLAVDRGVGVDDLAGSVGLVGPTMEEDLGVGVEDLEGLDVVLGTVFVMGRPVGVAGLDPGPLEEVGMRGPPVLRWLSRYYVVSTRYFKLGI